MKNQFEQTIDKLNNVTVLIPYQKFNYNNIPEEHKKLIKFLEKKSVFKLLNNIFSGSITQKELINLIKNSKDLRVIDFSNSDMKTLNSIKRNID